MRLGGPLFGDGIRNPQTWGALVRSSGYGTAYAPCPVEADDATVSAFRKAAKEHDVIIAEVGAWSNPISVSETERKAAEAKCIAALAHAERLGAVCTVNIAGSRVPDGFNAAGISINVVRKALESVK